MCAPLPAAMAYSWGNRLCVVRGSVLNVRLKSTGSCTWISIGLSGMWKRLLAHRTLKRWDTDSCVIGDNLGAASRAQLSPPHRQHNGAAGQQADLTSIGVSRKAADHTWAPLGSWARAAAPAACMLLLEAWLCAAVRPALDSLQLPPPESLRHTRHLRHETLSSCSRACGDRCMRPGAGYAWTPVLGHCARSDRTSTISLI